MIRLGFFLWLLVWASDLPAKQVQVDGHPLSVGLPADTSAKDFDLMMSTACSDQGLTTAACDYALRQKGMPFRRAWAERHNGVFRADVGWRDICARLAPGEAAIEFVRFREQASTGTEQPEHYAAFILLPDGTSPRFVRLCPAVELDAVLKYKTAPELQHQHLYAAVSNGASPLYPLVWQPLEAHLSGTKTVFFSPAGLLHRINLGAIQPQKRKCLADYYQLRQLSSLHVLLSEPPAHHPFRNAVVFAAPQFTPDGAESAGGWAHLPGAQEEGAEVLRLLGKNNFTVLYREGAGATEAALKRALDGTSPAPQVLHLATHGFYFQGTDSPTCDHKGAAFRQNDDPMVRTGILLAGANATWNAGRSLQPDEDDGVLTARELSRLNLRNTELAVLAAGESALVHIAPNEDAYGLPRACKLAGAQYVIGTLWTMPDRVFIDMMHGFYECWLDQHMSIPDAFLKAQAHMRAKHSNPYFWAGFVLIE